MKLVHALWILEALPLSMFIGSVALEDIEAAMAEIKFPGR